MSNHHLIDLARETDRFFDDTSLAGGTPPSFVLLMGGVCAGKTTLRRERYARGFVVVDAAEIFLSLSGGRYFEFPSVLDEPMELIGAAVAARAVREKRHIVTEIIGAEYEPMERLILGMRDAGYHVTPVFIAGDPDEGWRRNLARGPDNISAHFTEPYHRRWLLAAAAERGTLEQEPNHREP